MAVDPYYNNVSLLLHCDGVNNSTVFTDNSLVPKTVSRVGAVITTEKSVYGGACCKMAGAGNSYLRLDGSSDFAFGTSDFTIEFWYNPIAVDTSGSQYLYDSRPLGTNSGDYPIISMINGKMQYRVGGSGQITGTTNLVAGTWYHIAVSRVGNTTRLFINGTREGTNTTTLYNLQVGSLAPFIGANAMGLSSSGANGYGDELRVTKGIGRYTANFTPDPGASVYSSFIVGTINENLAATKFIARAYEMDTGRFIGSATANNSNSFTIYIGDPVPCCEVKVSIHYNIWKANKLYAIDDYVFPADPVATPYYYKRLSAGTSGAVEPSWPTTPGGQCDDGAVVNAWEIVERLVPPIMQGPLIPTPIV